MKFFLVLAALLALSSATTLFRGKDITFDNNGRILVTGYEGKQILVTKLDGRKFLEIIEPNMPNKMIEVVDDELFHTYDKDDLVFGTKTFHRYLVHLLNQLQDVLDEQSFHNLLMSVNNAYKSGHFTNTMYNLENREINDLIRDNQFVQNGVYNNKYHGLGWLYGKQNGLGYYRYAPVYQGRQNVNDYYGKIDTTRYVNPIFEATYLNKIAHREPVYNQYYQQYENIVPYNFEYYNQIPRVYQQHQGKTILDNLILDKNFPVNQIYGNEYQYGLQQSLVSQNERIPRVYQQHQGKTILDNLILGKNFPVNQIYGNEYQYGLQQPFVYQNERVHQYEPVVVPQIVY